MSRPLEAPITSNEAGNELLDALHDFTVFRHGFRTAEPDNPTQDTSFHGALSELRDKAYEFYERRITVATVLFTDSDTITKVRTRDGAQVGKTDVASGYMDFNQMALNGKLAIFPVLPRILSFRPEKHFNVNRWRRYDVNPFFYDTTRKIYRKNVVISIE